MLSALLAITLAQTTPKLDRRWVYVMTNLQVAKNADDLCTLITRAKKSGYNGVVIADSKLQRLDGVPDFYFTNANKVSEKARAEGVDLIPCVWPVGYAESMLGHDVNLVEGLPVKSAPFVVRGSDAKPQMGDQSLINNGGVEANQGDKVDGLSYQDAPGQTSFIDATEKHEGKQSVRLENFKGANSRLVWSLKTQPFHQYILSAWYKAEAYKGYTQAIALDGKGRNLAVTEISQAPTQPWTHVKLSFNSLESTDLKIYVGAWGGESGKMWWDDVSVTDAGLLNVIRRPGCPVQVIGPKGLLAEGKDYEPIRDPGLGVTPWAGEYDVDHAAPTIKILPAAGLKDGDLLSVSYFHAKTGIGNQASICLSEPKTEQVMADEAKRVVDLFHPKGLFWSHDEIRIGGWCDACTQRKLTPGEILAQNARQCGAIQQKLLPGSETYVWSDMFDPSHNAVDGYYLTNGTLAGASKGLPKDAVVVNWNSGKAAESLSFFASQGHKQILAGYYDGPVGSIKTWLAEASKVKGVCGVMYTTWVGDYANLEAFAKAAWGLSSGG